MTATILDGKAMSKEIRAEIAEDVARFVEKKGTKPCLTTVLVGDDPASEVYVRNKQRACQKAGMDGQHITLSGDTNTDSLLARVEALNADETVHGILVQLPLPAQIDESAILDAIRPDKDVDCFHPHNVGLMLQGRPRFLPCTPAGIQHLLIRRDVETSGAHVVIVGRSDIVGKPMAAMLMQKAAGANATVTVCHSRTRDLPAVARGADILIAAIGRAKFVTAEMIRPGATVVDVGINRTDDGLVGDVDFDAASEIAGAITPVPGGVGPLTITMLLRNTLTAAELQVG